MAFDVQGARQAGYTDQEIQTYLASKGQVTSQSQPQPQSGGLMKTLLPIALSIGGGILGAPFGPLGVIGGAAGGGALGGGLTGGNIGKEALFGGIGGLFPALKIGKLAGAGARAAEEAAAQGAERAGAKVAGKAGMQAATEGGENILTRIGQNFKRGATIAPKSSLDTFTEQKLLQETVDRYPQLVKASGTGKFQKVDAVIEDLSDDVDNLLKGVKTPIPTVNIGSVAENIAQGLNPNDRRSFVRIFNKAITDTFGDKIPESITPFQVNQIRRIFNRQASAAFRSIEKGGVLSAPNQAVIELRDLTSDLLTETVPQNLKNRMTALNKDMSVLIKGIPEFKNLSEQTMRVWPGIPIPGGERLKQKLLAQSGRGIEAGGKAAGRIPIPAGLAPNVVGQVGTRAMLGGMAPEEAQAAGPAIPTGQPSARSQQPNLTDILKMAALADLGKGGKNISEIIALSNFLNPPLGAATKTQLQQIEGAQTLVDQLENVYNQASQAGELGPYGKGTLSTLTGKISGGSIAGSAALYDNLRQGFTALIARSTGERGVLTDADAARARALIPTANTTPQFAARQFAEIRKIFRDAQARIGGVGQWSIPMPANSI